MVRCGRVNETLLPPNATLESALLLANQQKVLAYALQVYGIVSWILMALGVVGHTLGFVTLRRAASMQTPHFLFYKFMTLAELVYCINFFVSQIVQLTSMDKNGIFSNSKSAYFSCAIARFGYSATGYLVLYMAVFISVDRFAALWCTKLYRSFSTARKQKLTFFACIFASFLSAVAHSWTGIFKGIAPVTISNETFGYRCCARLSPLIYVKMKHINTFFNMGIRVSYPPVLLVLTVGVIWGFRRYQAHRASITRQSLDLRRLRERRRERNLVYLMGVVVFLAFLQVIPTEAKRYLQWTYHETEVRECMMMVANRQPIRRSDARTFVILWALFLWLRIFGNLATQIDRSLKFYLYVLFNNQFREEAARILGCGRFTNDARQRHRSLALTGAIPSQLFPNSALLTRRTASYRSNRIETCEC